MIDKVGRKNVEAKQNRSVIKKIDLSKNSLFGFLFLIFHSFNKCSFFEDWRHAIKFFLKGCIYFYCNCWFLFYMMIFIVNTTQRYTQIVTGRYARCGYLMFVFTMSIHWKWNNIAENSYFSRNRQNGRDIRIPCSQKCPHPSREIQVQTL